MALTSLSMLQMLDKQTKRRRNAKQKLTPVINNNAMARTTFDFTNKNANMNTNLFSKTFKESDYDSVKIPKMVVKD